jgi:uncharacterized membrane-anchored protein
MDFQDAPVITISDEQRKKHEAFIRQIMQKNDQLVHVWKENLRKQGYSDEEIENLMAY